MLQKRIDEIHQLLTRIERYNTIVTNDSFTPEALSDMKNNAKGFADQIKAKADEIKTEIDQW